MTTVSLDTAFNSAVAFPNAERHPHTTLYQVACRVFQALYMCFEYFFVVGSSLLHRCFFLPVSVPRRYLEVHSFNFARPDLLPLSLKTAMRPIPKSNFEAVRCPYPFQVTHDVIYQPAKGLCMGMCLNFLSLYYREGLLFAANELRCGGTETSLKIQALYDAWLGIQGTFDPQERARIVASMKGERVNRDEIQNQELLTSITAFAFDMRNKNFVDFVFDELKSRGVAMSPDLYALVWDLDAWRSNLGFSNQPNYQMVQNLIGMALCPHLGLEFSGGSRQEGEVGLSIMPDLETNAQGVEFLLNRENGSYLLSFPNHTVVYIKTQDSIAVYDPSIGLAIANDIEDRNELLSHLLNHFSNGLSMSLESTSVKKIVQG